MPPLDGLSNGDRAVVVRVLAGLDEQEVAG